MIKFSKYENDFKMFKKFMRFAGQLIQKFLISEYQYDNNMIKTPSLYDLTKFGKDVTNFKD